MKVINPISGQNTGPIEVHNTSDRDERDVQDLNSSQIEDNGTTPENEGNNYISDGQGINNAVQDDQTSRASQDDNYHTAIDDEDLDYTVQFGNPVTESFLSRSIRIPTTEVGCLSFTQMFQEYLEAYPSCYKLKLSIKLSK